MEEIIHQVVQEESDELKHQLIQQQTDFQQIEYIKKQEYETKLEEVKAAMEEYRTSKAEIDKKKLAAKDKINGIKGPHNKK
jgi:hypothetical protein